ncbi:serine/threonine-protein kinase [Spiroplasma endosymbiont of Labia minor]|uniref:serine/threonine-protein kinase n=1 Tax=Spiroplasma endosymbiont of Labia minor TaxID=3066305 RepID=UPI0030D1F43D
MAEDDKYALNSGDIIHKRYEIIKRYGQGGMATVYKAYDIMTQRNVALKVINPDVILKETGPKRYEIERESLARLADHPNVVPLYDVFQDQGFFFIAMGLLEGGTLKNKFNDFGIMTIEELQYYFGEIANGLSAAHKLGIIHRDIKPDNILISSSGDVKISDFGISIMIDNKSGEEQKPVGTPKYMSPEQILGFEVNNQTDIYALGVMLYEFSTGVAPFLHMMPKVLATMHINKPVIPPRELNPNIPQALENIIMKSVAKNLDERYKTIDEFAKDLKNVTKSVNDKPLVFRQTFDYFNEKKGRIIKRPATSHFNSLRRYLKPSYTFLYTFLFTIMLIALIILLIIL